MIRKRKAYPPKVDYLSSFLCLNPLLSGLLNQSTGKAPLNEPLFDFIDGKRISDTIEIVIKIELRREWCKGCNLCVQICPKAVFDRESKISARGFKEIIVKQPEKCSGCQLCEMLCPDLAITVSKTTESSEIK